MKFENDNIEEERDGNEEDGKSDEGDPDCDIDYIVTTIHSDQLNLALQIRVRNSMRDYLRNYIMTNERGIKSKKYAGSESGIVLIFS